MTIFQHSVSLMRKRQAARQTRVGVRTESIVALLLMADMAGGCPFGSGMDYGGKRLKLRPRLNVLMYSARSGLGQAGQ